MYYRIRSLDEIERSLYSPQTGGQKQINFILTLFFAFVIVLSITGLFIVGPL